MWFPLEFEGLGADSLSSTESWQTQVPRRTDGSVRVQRTEKTSVKVLRQEGSPLTRGGVGGCGGCAGAGVISVFWF